MCIWSRRIFVNYRKGELKRESRGPEEWEREEWPLISWQVWYPPVEHKLHRTQTSDKATLRLFRVKIKTRPLRKHAWAETQHGHCSSYKVDQMSPLLANGGDCCSFTTCSIGLPLACPPRQHVWRGPVVESPPLADSAWSRAEPHFLKPSPTSPNTSSNPTGVSNTLFRRLPTGSCCVWSPCYKEQ